MYKIICILLAFTLNSLASPNFGKNLPLATDPQTGHLQLGVHFAYDSGYVGNKFTLSWGILFGSALTQPDLAVLPAELKWNLYNETSANYLTDWAQASTLASRDLLLGTVSAQDSLAKLAIGNQGKLILVFADLSGKPLYNLNLGHLCKTQPSYFVNLTETSKKCDQVSVSEIDQAQIQFCADSTEELLTFVHDGTLSCKKATEMSVDRGCAVLACK